MGIPGTCEVPMFPAGTGPEAPDRRTQEPGGKKRCPSDPSESTAAAGAVRRIHKSHGMGMGKS
jgi:hypothetical protein